MIPFRFDEAQKRLAKLVEFDVDIYLQPEREACAGQERIPLWIRDYGYSQQGISFLIEKRQKWYSGEKVVHTLAVGDRIAVFSDVSGGGIGVVREINGDEMYYTMFSLNVVYRKPVKEVLWNEKNWRWETTGVGSIRRLQLADGALTKCSPLRRCPSRLSGCAARRTALSFSSGLFSSRHGSYMPKSWRPKNCSDVVRRT